MKPELLAPAKNLERLKVAVLYGADAVYVGGQKYGLRAGADNFTQTELERGVAFAHQHNAKVYVTLNAFLHDADFDGLDSFCGFMERIGVDAVIASDLGVIKYIHKCSNLPVHLSTQSSCLNLSAAKLWKRLGVKRLIVGRELQIAEAGKIQREAGIEVEMFVHGAMCMAYSGRCTISNFTSGRDSNRGGCIQSCRFHYQQKDVEASEEEDWQLTSKFMSSKDLWGLHTVGDFFKEGICSLKVEGRMRSNLYVATTTKAYRKTIDAHAENQLDQQTIEQGKTMLKTIPHRGYFSGSLEQRAGMDSVYLEINKTGTGTHRYTGIVLDANPEHFVVRLFAPLRKGDTIEILPFEAPRIRLEVDAMHSVMGKSLDAIRQDNVVCIPRTSELTGVDAFNVVRAPVG